MAIRHRRENGQYTHEFYWVPATPEYGLLLATPVPADSEFGQSRIKYERDGRANLIYAAGSLCYGCGEWDGPPLKRGEAKRFLSKLAASKRKEMR